VDSENAKHLEQDRPNGPVMAIMLAGGLGAAALGLTTTLGEAFAQVQSAFAWWAPAGPLTGVALTSVFVFFVAWAALHSMFRGKDVRSSWAIVVSFVLLGLGLIGTFPPFYDLFAAK